MPAHRRVQDTHISGQLRELHEALLSLGDAMNRPENDKRLLEDAGVSLDRALFPLLVRIEKLGPIGVVDLAARVGRDYTTVSRQVAKLQSIGLVKRQPASADRRINEAVITPEGKAMTDSLQAARDRLGRTFFSNWSERDFSELVRLVRKLAQQIASASEINPAHSRSGGR
jgi:DNA-binding MarR family transcriptional regulator